MEPQYAFSIPSVEDDTPLDCRIYHPSDLVTALGSNGESYRGVKGAIVAHPYAPLGGCYDDQVVLSVAQTLLDQSCVVGTFNFRGAGDSIGRTSWTGKPEMQDYISFAGFMIYYLQHLAGGSASSEAQNISNASTSPISLILGGYSYGSLILARFPPTNEIVSRFEAAERGTAAAEIIMRARTLAKQTLQSFESDASPASPRGRTLKPEQSPTSPSKRVSPMTVGGEETDPAERRRSRDSRRSVDVIHKTVEVPHRIKAHIKHRHASREQPQSTDDETNTAQPQPPTRNGPRAPKVLTSYLFISPVLMPFSSRLLPPGAPTSGFSFSSGKGDNNVSSRQYFQHPTLALFGSRDAFTSSKRLRHWAENHAQATQGLFEWSEIEDAGHFWGEAGVLRTLQKNVRDWVAGARKG